jgi:hypothetical protein
LTPKRCLVAVDRVSVSSPPALRRGARIARKGIRPPGEFGTRAMIHTGTWAADGSTTDERIPMPPRARFRPTTLALIVPLQLLTTCWPGPVRAGGEADTRAPTPEVRSSAFTHDGFYLRGGLGVGGLSASPSIDGEPQTNVSMLGGGIGAAAMIGGALSPGVFLGGAVFLQQAFNPQYKENGVTYQSNTDKSLNFGFIGPFIDWYPHPRDGFHVGGFVGFARLTMTNPNGDATSYSPIGGAGGFLLGHDFWVDPHWCLGLSLHAVGGRVAGTPELTQPTNSRVATAFGVGQLFVSMLFN